MAALGAVLFLLLAGVNSNAQDEAWDFEDVADHVTRTLERDRVPGAAVAIVRGTEVLFLQGFGEDEQGRPIEENTGFVIGSMSKAFSALLAMRLVEAEVVELDTPVGTLVPELRDSGNAAWRDITLGHLLTHTSGVPARTPELPSEATLAQHVSALAQVDLIDGPGARHIYSSANYLLVARMLEMASGVPFDTLLGQQVFEPLGIGPANATNEAPEQYRTSTGHRYWFVWPKPADLPPEPGRLATAFVTASAADMARFLQFQLGDGTWNGQSLLSSAGLARMHAGTAQGDGFKYGLGWREADLAGVHTVQHGGILPNYRGKMLLLPELDLGVVVLTNVSSLLPLPIQPTSHRLANELAIHLAGGPLGLPALGYRIWLLVFWSGLAVVLLHQLSVLLRVAFKRDRARHPLRSAAADIAMVLALVLILPRFIGLSLERIATQVPDLMLCLALISAMAISSAGLRILYASKSGHTSA